MPKPLLYIFVLLLASPVMSQSTVRIEIKKLPAYHPSGSEIYIAGSFNDWNAQDKNYRFQKTAKGDYYINLKLNDGKYEYKIARGSWDKAECKKGGAFLPNHDLVVPGDTVIQLDIEEWSDRFPAKPRVSTASKNVHIIDTAFVIPQLKRIRRVWIYLPEGYEKSGKHYPVLYMHDGQNVFDDSTSYAGEWGVDECLDTMKKKCIVVAVDHGGTKRMNEYCPYDMERFGKGEGDKYVDFLVITLKPYIDKHYRTLKTRENTFVAGSSMGGIISLYAVLKYPGVFGGAGVFSPSFGIGPKIFDDIKAKGKKVNAKIYFYAGKQEGEGMVPDMQKAFDLMKQVSKSTMTTVIRDDGKHNETRWRVEFPLFYKWLMK
ncbi:MAG: alpha/beta hydrolase-fold protein [Bacteroidota bacterium]|nr:alpha/beta hydrolase-fold protein [Bacteroidota bacterium]